MRKKIVLTKSQSKKLSDLAMDLAKGILLSSFAVPLFDHPLSWSKSIISIVEGLILVVMSLKLEKDMEEMK